MDGGRSVPMPEDRLQLALREASRVAGVVALYCDRTEHNEPASSESLLAAAARLRQLASFMATSLDVDLRELYGARLEHLERVSPMEPLLPSPAADVRRARTWRDLQVAQLRHDRHYHADVFGLAKRDQLIHMALHLSKLAGAVALLFEADHGTWLDFSRRRLPDMLLFGIKIATVAGSQLDATPIEADLRVAVA